MKKTLILALVMVVGLATTAFAAGPTLGFSVVPLGAGSPVGFSLGYDFPNLWALEVGKADFSAFNGPWTITALWRPEIGTLFQDTFGVLHFRAGIQGLFTWFAAGGLTFDGIGGVLGIQHYWNILSVYGELQLTSTGLLTPTIGVQVEIPVGGEQTKGNTL